MSERSGYYFDVHAYRNSRHVRRMTMEARGIYREILDEIWLHGSIPSDVTEIALMLQIDVEMTIRCWPSIHACLVPCKSNPDQLTSERMEEERAKRDRIRKLRKAFGKKGGVAKAKQKASLSLAKLKQDPSNTRQEQDKTSILFIKFWSVYPRRVGKKAAEKIWNHINPDENLAEKIFQTIDESKRSDAWLRDQGRFIPHPATWLNQGRWDDEITQPIARVATVAL